MRKCWVRGAGRVFERWESAGRVVPRCDLQYFCTPSGYSVVATCVDGGSVAAIRRWDGRVRYRWGIKRGDSSIVWRETTSPQLCVAPDDDEPIVVLLEVTDGCGYRQPIVHVMLRPHNIYYTSCSTYYYTSDDRFFEEHMEPFSLDSAMLDLVRRIDVPARYMSAEWRPCYARVLVPSGNRWSIDLSNREIALQDVLTPQERAWMRDNCADQEEVTYIVELENVDHRCIQYLPIPI